ncbi:hypothetical protein ABPG73_011392 [Tetrahymena malaccensis]
MDKNLSKIQNYYLQISQYFLQIFIKIFSLIQDIEKSSNKIGDVGSSGLGYGLASCINLSSLALDLGWNQIGDEGASSLGSGLASCINLSNLTLNLGQKQLIYFRF